MSRAPLAIDEHTGREVLSHGDSLIAVSSRTLRVTRPGLAPVLYFPREDVRMARLTMTAYRPVCPVLGPATHFTVTGEAANPAPNAAWSYEDPPPIYEALRGRIAFWRGDLEVLADAAFAR